MGGVTGALSGIPGAGPLGLIAGGAVGGALGNLGDQLIAGGPISISAIGAGAVGGGLMAGGGVVAGKAASRIKTGVRPKTDTPPGSGSRAGVEAPSLPCGNHSFPGETRVVLADGGSKPISDVTVGDEVATVDAETGERSNRVVIRTITRRVVASLMVAVTLATGGVINATGTHPFLVPDEGKPSSHQIAAAELKPGDQVRTGDGDTTTIVKTRHYTADQPVYNLTVDQTHTYLIHTTSDDIAVHNCGLGTPLDWSYVSKKGETRRDHVALHESPDSGKAQHGVFNGDSYDLTNEAWDIAMTSGITPTSGGRSDVYRVPMGKHVGAAGGKDALILKNTVMEHIEVVVFRGTNLLLTSYPAM